LAPAALPGRGDVRQALAEAPGRESASLAPAALPGRGEVRQASAEAAQAAERLVPR